MGTDIGVTESLLKTKQNKIVRYSRLHAARSPLEIWDSCSLTEFMTLWSERSRLQLFVEDVKRRVTMITDSFALVLGEAMNANIGPDAGVAKYTPTKKRRTRRIY